MTTATLSLSKATQKARQIIESALTQAMRAAALQAIDRHDWSALAATALDAADDPIDEACLAEAAVEILNSVKWKFEMSTDVELDVGST